MTAAAFDTREFASTLREKAKLSPAQADGLADAMVGLFASRFRDEHFATRADLQVIRADIAALKVQLQTDVAAGERPHASGPEAFDAGGNVDLRHHGEAEVRHGLSASQFAGRMCGIVGFQTIVFVGALIAVAHAMR